jgi:hypothetical protein
MAGEYNTEWNDVPNTYPNAKPESYRQVKNVLAVLIHEGFLRGSTFNDCYFEVADSLQPFDVFDGKTRVEVQVLWFNRKPVTTWAHITLNGKYELLRNYSGEVVANIDK